MTASAPRTMAPYGSWRSPLAPAALTRGMRGIGFLEPARDGVLWLEQRPEEGGRSALVFGAGDGSTRDVIPAEFNARTRVHEYGGANYTCDAERVWFTNFSDQRIWQVGLSDDGEPARPEPVTPADGRRYADLVLDAGRNRLLAICETDREAGEPHASLVAIPLGRAAGRAEPETLAKGHDFFSTPRLSPDGSTLCWLTWDHPAMPWDATTLWQAALDAPGRLQAAAVVAGGPGAAPPDAAAPAHADRGESIFQPEWAPDGRLWYISDRSGWWNLYRRERDGRDTPMLAHDADFGLPQWQFGMRTYAFVGDGRVLCTWQTGDGTRAGLLAADGHSEPLDLPYTSVGGPVGSDGRAWFIGARSDAFPELVELDIASGECRVRQRAATLALDPADIARPEPLSYPTGDGEQAHAFFYRPANARDAAPPDEQPPLLVMSHGGPTGATSATLGLKVQFWTSRGIAVLDVNYRGSTGFGRAYRDRLKGGWGVVDVEDCVAGARYLADAGRVDPQRLAIRGSSAGGYTTLAALTFADTFRAGASLYGIGDLETLARDTHKFEAHYLDSLVGPWPNAAATYRARSPIHHPERLACPIIFLQGLEDRIVPPEQAEAMVAALEAREIPVAYVAFEGEQHGFRKAENIRRALEAELYFYGRIFGFEPADTIEPIVIEHLT